MLTDARLRDEFWMRHALRLADNAVAQGEIPVGAVLVNQNQLIAEAWNRPIQLIDPTAHAEIIAIRAGAQALQNYRLLETTLYVTLEPCVMCAAALLHARVKRVVFGAYDPKAGAAGSRFDVLRDTRHNHQIDCIGGVLAEECGEQLRQFFQEKREFM
jgi:tRNA(adenine34) deaminase